MRQHPDASEKERDTAEKQPLHYKSPFLLYKDPLPSSQVVLHYMALFRRVERAPVRVKGELYIVTNPTGFLMKKIGIIFLNRRLTEGGVSIIIMPSRIKENDHGETYLSAVWI